MASAIATSTQCAHYILSSGYMETPTPYIDHSEVNNAIKHAKIESTRVDPSSTFQQVWNNLEMSTKLSIVDEIKTKSIDEIIGHLTVLSTKHPVACIVVTPNGQSTCIASYDGYTTKYTTLVNDSLVSFDNEFSVEVPLSGSSFTGYLVESSFYKEARPVQNKKRSKKGKEEEEVEIEDTPTTELKIEEEEEQPKKASGRKRKSTKK